MRTSSERRSKALEDFRNVSGHAKCDSSQCPVEVDGETYILAASPVYSDRI